MAEMGSPFAESPLFHSACHEVCHFTGEFSLTTLYFFQFPNDRVTEVLAHFCFGETVDPIEIGYRGFCVINIEHDAILLGGLL
ncbi:hypothetical protein SDC9_99314 [bioreactor metagenome]|uniref:Uncharacterized protein n=1 Tax=bioreactor metagenome TaxID=1076179 RepID=A0A645ASJ0_9ZZZZ